MKLMLISIFSNFSVWKNIQQTFYLQERGNLNVLCNRRSSMFRLILVLIFLGCLFSLEVQYCDSYISLMVCMQTIILHLFFWTCCHNFVVKPFMQLLQYLGQWLHAEFQLSFFYNSGGYYNEQLKSFNEVVSDRWLVSEVCLKSK